MMYRNSIHVLNCLITCAQALVKNRATGLQIIRLDKNNTCIQIADIIL